MILPRLLLLIHRRLLPPLVVLVLHLHLHNLALLPHVLYVAVKLHPPRPQFRTQIPPSHYQRSQLRVEMISKLEMLTCAGFPSTPKTNPRRQYLVKLYKSLHLG